MIPSPKHKYTSSLITCALLLSGCVLLLSGCTPKNKSTANYLSDTRVCLDTFITITIYGSGDKDILENSFALVNKYQDIFSRTLNYSELYKINSTHEKKIPISPEMADILRISLEYSEKTNGAFDPTIGVVSSLWDFKADSPSLPGEDRLKKALEHIDYRNISLENEGEQTYLIKKDTSAVLELGGIAKGYIADRVKEYLESSGIESALIDLGGNILCVGEKTDGSPFRVGVLKPFTDNSYLTVLDVKDASLVTSGSYQRYFKKDNKLYHHILNPSTGMPVDNGLLSVTILTKHSVDADALSTSCFILGPEKGMELINSLEDTEAVFVDEDFNLTCSSGLQNPD